MKNTNSFTLTCSGWINRPPHIIGMKCLNPEIITLKTGDPLLLSSESDDYIDDISLEYQSSPHMNYLGCTDLKVLSQNKHDIGIQKVIEAGNEYRILNYQDLNSSNGNNSQLMSSCSLIRFQCPDLLSLLNDIRVGYAGQYINLSEWMSIFQNQTVILDVLVSISDMGLLHFVIPPTAAPIYVTLFGNE